MSPALSCFPVRRRPYAAAAVGAGFALVLLAGAPAAAPRIAAPQATFNFGVRDGAETVTNRFVLRNTGDALLVIGETRASCGCTRVAPERRLLQPGEETGVEVRLILNGLQGPQRKSVHVASNDPDTPSLALWMEGEARSAVQLEPANYSFGRINPSDPPAPVTVQMTGYATNVVIVSATSDTPAFPVSVAPGGRALTLAPPHLTTPGAWRGKVRVVFSDPAQPPVDLHLYAWLNDALQISPTSLVFRSGSAPATARTVVVRRCTAPRFRIVAVRLDGAVGRVEALPQPDGSYQVRVEQVIPDSLGTNAAIVIRTDLAERPEWRVTLRRE
jgi:hypothetical protein